MKMVTIKWDGVASNEGNRLKPCSKSTTFWGTLSKDLRCDNLPSLSADVINNNSEMLPLLVYTSMQEKSKSRMAREIKVSARIVVNGLVQKCPDQLRRNLREEYSDRCGSDVQIHLKDVMYHQFKRYGVHYKNLRVSVPESYNMHHDTI
mmetsp:Transcript_21311/g.45037  ORF Transcript_21311/g.45037 Transcript_21311/m.45037 type:complete len:149 (-) Transcript_21311:162-608(-)|eukprot:CAMPEP_0183727356 /NCGR_PEP_ID=MMETSP0737-20130205/25487_1 /TAXON_ID=385413 /ORGANISM="Thalassiosira miniscula, Strain CCMP1093" /LENGTH=148 /DNA_ID=CAMNT_0025958961 /DNA_START=238 /DNA_END=684 /DNA_ORIENTATION=+